MSDILIKRISNLLTVKSIMTIILTIVFAVMALRGDISHDFMTIYAVVTSFYFGTQVAKDTKGGVST